MKNRDYWHWLEEQPDHIRKSIIERSPWYNLPKDTPVWLNRLTTKRCHVEIDGHIYKSELTAESEKYLWGYSSWVNDDHYYSTGTIKEQFEYCYSKKGLALEIDVHLKICIDQYLYNFLVAKILILSLQMIVFLRHVRGQKMFTKVTRM